MAKLNLDFYLDDDVVKISKSLLGKYLFTLLPDQSNTPVLTGGIIVETEAYAGITDRASHAYNNRRTKRTETMFHRGGVTYVYLCYGIHSMLNIVTNKENIPHAILIRALEPTHGIKTMLQRRGMKKIEKRLTSGPGSLSKALGITTKHDCIPLTENKIWIEDPPAPATKIKIVASPRIGIDYAGIDAKRPWRFTIKNNKWCS